MTSGFRRQNILSTFLFFIFLFMVTLDAQTPEDMIKVGNRFYQSGQYENAIEAYHKILTQGYESPALYYNIGNAYFRTGQLGYAILYYEKALKLAPGDEDISYNLRIANARTIDKITEVPKLFIVQWWDVLITSLSLTGWSLITILLYLVFLTGIGLYLLSKRNKIQRIAFMIGSFSLSILLIAAVILYARYDNDASTNYGILLEPSYSVKIAPDPKSNDAFVIHEGIKFAVDDHVSNWVKIRLVDGKVGWIPRNVYGQI